MRFSRAGYFYIVLSLHLISGFFLLSASSVPPATRNDSDIESGLHFLFARDFGYTLLGEKPVSTEDSFYRYNPKQPTAITDLFEFLHTSFSRSQNFIVKTFSSGRSYQRIEFINKASVKKIINSSNELQLFIKQNFSSRSEFYKRLFSSKESLFALLNHDRFLIGLVHGYGKANSQYCSRRCAIGQHLQKYSLFSLLPFDHKPHIVSICFNTRRLFRLASSSQPQEPPPIMKGFLSLEEEWDWMQKVEWKIERSPLPTPPYYIALPWYICRHGGDSEQVRSTYIKARDRLANLFHNRSFQEVILEMASKKST